MGGDKIFQEHWVGPGHRCAVMCWEQCVHSGTSWMTAEEEKWGEWCKNYQVEQLFPCLFNSVSSFKLHKQRCYRTNWFSSHSCLFALSALLFPSVNKSDGQGWRKMGWLWSIWGILLNLSSCFCNFSGKQGAGGRVRKWQQKGQAGGWEEGGENDAWCGHKLLIQAGEGLLTTSFFHNSALSGFPNSCDCQHVLFAACQLSRYPPLAGRKSHGIVCFSLQGATARCFVTIFTVSILLWGFFLFKTY